MSEYLIVAVPMKPLAACKQRLAAVLAPEQRSQLSLWMLERVLLALGSVRPVAQIVVLGGDLPIQDVCKNAGAAWEPDDHGNLNAAVNGFYRKAGDKGYGHMLYLASDLPTVETPVVEALIEEAGAVDLVLTPGARDGTNAVLLRCGLPFEFQLGEQSYLRHRQQGQALGLRWKDFRAEALFADVDLPSDLAWLEREHPELWKSVALASGMAS
jgi:2-phospho-L-lactate guanylyltransferase